MSYEELKRLIEHLGVHAELGPHGQGWGIEQNPHEFATFLTKAGIPKTVLEIGTGYKGGLARFLSEAFQCDVTTIDINRCQVDLPKVKQVIGRSEDVVGEVYGHYDLIIIDGDHTYDAVKLDYALYASMGDVVMLHDIAGLRQCEGVARFWKELARTKRGKLRKDYHEAIDKGTQKSGIGWVVNGK